MLGATYTAIVDVGNRDNPNANANKGTYSIALFEDGVEVPLTRASLEGNQIAVGTFAPLSTVSYVATSTGADLTVELRWTQSITTGPNFSGPYQGVFDNLQVFDAPVPEPTILSLAAASLLVSVRRRR